MARCDHCGNEYDKAFVVEMDGSRYTFDSFECAAHKLAPSCGTCGVRVLGHGTEANGQVYCCDHCRDAG